MRGKYWYVAYWEGNELICLPHQLTGELWQYTALYQMQLNQDYPWMCACSVCCPGGGQEGNTKTRGVAY